jgi:hypothetical protein
VHEVVSFPLPAEPREEAKEDEETWVVQMFTSGSGSSENSSSFSSP